MKKKSNIAVSLVLHNEATHIPRLAKALKEQSIQPYGIYATDNNSTDKSAAMLQELLPGSKINLSGENPGYGAAHNQNMKRAFSNGADAVLVINTDTEPDKDCISVLSGFIDRHPDIGIVSILILYGTEDGKSNTIQSFRITADLKKGHIKSIDEGKMLDQNALPKSEAVNYFSGTACLITRETYITIGGFTEDNFLYGEEMDYSYRASLKGIKMAAVRDAKVWHYHEWSRKNLEGLCREYYLINRNRIRYFKKYGLKTELLNFIVSEMFIFPLRLFWTLRKGGVKFTRCFYRGIVHGLKSKTKQK